MDRSQNTQVMGGPPWRATHPALIACFWQLRCSRIFANDRDPAGLRGLPGALILAAGIRPVDQLVAVYRRPADVDRECGARKRLEAGRDLAEIKVNIGDDLSGLLGNGVERTTVTVRF